MPLSIWIYSGFSPISDLKDTVLSYQKNKEGLQDVILISYIGVNLEHLQKSLTSYVGFNAAVTWPGASTCSAVY